MMLLRRMVLRRLLFLLMVASALIGGYFLFIYFFPSPPRVKLSRNYSIRKGEKVLVFAPHSDDETLGAGGLIQAALRAGADVHVALVTNGDGFTLAVEDEFHTVKVTPARYVQLAYIRQGETLSALESLGIPPEKVFFLGFPDRGTPEEWENHWLPSNPYRSRFTKMTSSPYRNSFQRRVPFAGERLADNIETVLKEVDPDTIVLPHPNDTHPDHWGTNAFVLYALADLGALGHGRTLWGPKAPEMMYYLVHRGDWPAPKGLLLHGRLLPPAHLLNLGMTWGLLPLTSEETKTKYGAILRYRSQVNVMRRYLVSFARSNELFGDVPLRRVPRVSLSGVAPEKGIVWPESSALLREPVGDTVAREAQGEADIKLIRVGQGPRGELAVGLETRRPLTPAARFELHVHAMAEERLAEPRRFDVVLRRRAGAMEALSRGNGWKSPVNVPVTTNGNRIDLVLPPEAAGSRGIIFVAAESWVGKLHIDRSSWRILAVR
jgi:LmbE family N-acetylglucosaminyl deacetylase